MSLPAHSRFAERLYALRWPLSLALLGGVLALSHFGWRWVESFSTRVDSLRDPDAIALGRGEPKLFDTRYDLWFHPEDPGLEAYQEIERQFIAEDYVLVTFEEREHPLGVFSPQSLTAIRRLTSAIERVPYVRRVRSLTSNPWIRWGTIGENAETGELEEGLIVSDLFEEDPPTYAEVDVLERMIAILGAERAARLVGEERVREILGPDRGLEDAIGEPRLIGSIISDDGRTSALQVQVLRPPIDGPTLDRVFGDDDKARLVGPSMFANEAQWAALAGIRRALLEEAGLSVERREFQILRDEVAKMPEGEAKDLLAKQISNPSLDEIVTPNGRRVAKFLTYARNADGSLLDVSDPSAPRPAPPDFRATPRSDYEFHLAGMPLFMKNFQDVGMRDMQYVVWMFAMLVVVLLVIFRRASGVALPLMVIGASVVGMFGSVWVFRDSLNNLTAITPNMVTAIGIADAIHLLAAYFVLRPRYSDRRLLIVEVIRRNALPVFLTTLTTAVGFFSLTTSTIVPMQMLGYTAGIGTIFAYLLSMTWVPAVLSLLSAGSKEESATEAETIESSVWSDRLVAFVLGNRTKIVVVSCAVVVVALVGLSRIELDSDFRAMFPESNPVMSDFRWTEKRLGGAGDLELVFKAPAHSETPDTAEARRLRIEELASRQTAQQVGLDGIDGLDPLSPTEKTELESLQETQRRVDRRRIAVSSDFLSEVEAFQRRLEQEIGKPGAVLEPITKLSGPLDVLRKIHQVQNENRASAYRVPTDADVAEAARVATVSFDEITEDVLYTPPQTASTLAAQYYLQFENGAKPSENLSTLVSADRTLFRVQGRVRQCQSTKQQAAFDRIVEIARSEFPRLASTDAEIEAGRGLSTLTVSGKTVLYATMTEKFSLAFIRSLSLALVVITIVIGVIFRSFIFAILSIVPNVLPIVVPLSVFGLFGWALDSPAILVASVALGVCVDDTVHFFTKFTRARKSGLATPDALRSTFAGVGRALTVTSIVLVLGFAVLSLSQFTPNRLMGQLAVVMIALAWLADFVVTPALLSLIPDRSES